MSDRLPHIVSVNLPELPLKVVEAIESEGLSAVGDVVGPGVLTVIVTFGAGQVYEYPNVPLVMAVAVKADPEPNFPSIRYWPGYRRIE